MDFQRKMIREQHTFLIGKKALCSFQMDASGISQNSWEQVKSLKRKILQNQIGLESVQSRHMAAAALLKDKDLRELEDSFEAAAGEHGSRKSATNGGRGWAHTAEGPVSRVESASMHYAETWTSGERSNAYSSQITLINMIRPLSYFIFTLEFVRYYRGQMSLSINKYHFIH